jgi:hypothetical protein
VSRQTGGPGQNHCLNEDKAALTLFNNYATKMNINGGYSSEKPTLGTEEGLRIIVSRRPDQVKFCFQDLLFRPDDCFTAKVTL